MERCPACGERSDHCTGHGSIGDPQGFRTLLAHDKGRHDACSPNGCDTAFDVWVTPLIPAEYAS